jgi:membrane fusion protein, heavy metal efflux system
MKFSFLSSLSWAMVSVLLFSCSHKHTHEHETEQAGLEPLAYTLYTDHTELFVEFKPLVAGTESAFAAHFTALGEQFEAFTEGNITLTIDVNGDQVATTATEPQVPGIFRLRLTPNSSGTARLTFDIKTKAFTDQIIIDQVTVYADESAAMADQPEESGGSDITYLKEQAWKVEFANAPVVKSSFSNIIKTSGQILPAPGDEIMVTAKASGMVLFSGNNTIIGSAVKAGSNLFTITGGDLAEGNLDANFKEAKSNYEKAKADYDRATELIADQIVSQKDFQQAKLEFENAQTAYNAIAKNYTAKGQTVSSSINGFVKDLYVSEGQFVEAGTPLASISRNKNLILQANVSQKYFEQLSSISSANFETTESETVYSTAELNGKIISYGKSASASSPFIPITFQIDNISNLIPGSVVEVYLKSSPIPDALIIPVSSLLEEQGNFFVYVQTGGESFQKREVKLGANDGVNIQLLSGVQEGERVVTKGAYNIKLSSATGTLPTHGHEH